MLFHFRRLTAAALAAVLLTGVAAAQEGEKKGDKQEPKKIELPGGIDLGDLLKKLPPGIMEKFQNLPIDPQELLKKLKDLDPQKLGDLRKLMEQFGGGQRPQRPGKGGADARLGAELQKPAEVLVAQLGLAEGKGLVVSSVKDDSPAAKAGIKANDVLLKLAGKDVSSNMDEFQTLLKGVKANEPVDAVVLRKGKEETVKGLSLPEAKKERTRPKLPKLDLKRKKDAADPLSVPAAAQWRPAPVIAAAVRRLL